MFFVILGRHKKLSLEEIKLCIWEDKIITVEDDVVLLNGTNDGSYIKKYISRLAGIVKRWILLRWIENIEEVILSSWRTLVGTNSIKLAKYLKDKWLIKRYKIVDLLHTDIEVKSKGIEILVYKKFFLYVKNYQNINIYELIDFWKPVRSMKIWMMPSKLVHMMINIVTKCDYVWNLWDPFCWLGTTLFMADWLDFWKIWGSDINTSPSKQNLKWWVSKVKPDSKIDIFKYDVLKPFNKKFLHWVDWIVTEWYLGPVVTSVISDELARKYESQVSMLYMSLFSKIFPVLQNLKGVIFCLPVYKLKWWKDYYFENFVVNLNRLIKNFNFKLNILPQVYRRKNQKVGRQILVLFRW